MSPSAWTPDAIPDLTGRTAVVTGANTGLGREVARELAARGATVVLAVRDVDKGRAAASAIGTPLHGVALSVQPLDLASLASVHRAATSIRDAYERIDLVVNNAGVMGTDGATTVDGFELQLGVNHLGHFAFTGLLLDRLLPVEGARVVTVGSIGHWLGRRIELGGRAPRRRPFERYGAYARSKLANLLFTYELDRRLTAAGTRTLAVAAHPGWASTGIVRNSSTVLRAAERIGRPLGQSPRDGALPILRAATDPDAIGGAYYGPGGLTELRGPPRVVRSSDRSYDPELARRLWEASEALTGVSFPV